MRRLTRTNTRSRLITTATFLITAVVGLADAQAAPPYAVQHADYDFEGAGYVTPAGMVPPSMYTGDVMPVGYFQSGGGCASCGSSCDSMYYGGGCDSCCGGAGCGSIGCGLCSGADDGCGTLGCGGVLGSMRGDSSLRHLCFFCRGSGCSACQLLNPGTLAGLLQQFRPYGEAGLCALRWYDLSAEATFLGHTSGGGDMALTQNNAGMVVLTRGATGDGGSLQGGMRFSGAMIFGPGSNLEVTYMGNNSWSGSAAARDPNAQLTSFISDFGNDVINGFDDTDNSLIQSLSTTSEFHSGELNYRRRTMGPYCRFQASWLLGLRYLQFKNGLIYQTIGEINNGQGLNLPRFFRNDDDISNNIFGPQAGFDVWWNAQPGVQFGIGFKGAWVQNDIKRSGFINANSLNAGFPGTVRFTSTTRDTSLMGEFETKMIYRLSHSWSFRTAYHLIAADDVGFAGLDANYIRAVAQNNNTAVRPALSLESLVVQGFTFGAEYIW